MWCSTRSIAFVALAFAPAACSFGAPTAEDHDELPADDLGDDTARAPVEYNKDGTVDVGVQHFETVTEFQRSAEFQLSGRRCATDDVPDIAAFDPSDCSFSSTKILGDYAPDATLTIPVVFHVVKRTDGTGDVSEALIHSQIDILNEDFDAIPGTPGAGGTAGRIRFALATVDPDGNPTTGIEVVTNDAWFADPGSGDSPMKTALGWDPANYFNIYTNDANGALGYATFPSQNAGQPQDGVVLLWNAVGRDAPGGGEYNQGRTATHEVGHYLGLFHTFQGGCGNASAPYGSGDLIKDTNAHPSPNFTCTTGTSTCGGGAALPIENYMNYTNDTCMTRFSVEQVNRMRCSIQHYRPELFTASNNTGNQAPNVSFTATTDGLAATLTSGANDPDGEVTSQTWTFGDGSTATGAGASHAYAVAGTYTVTLTVTDDDGATASASKAITVSSGATGSVLTSGAAVGPLSAPTGGELRFTIEVPPGAGSLTVQTAGGPGDADLYVRLASAPTTATYDQRGYRSGNAENLTFATPAAGTYHIMVRGYAAFSAVSLVATVAD
jgi:hypothetical protein